MDFYEEMKNSVKISLEEALTFKGNDHPGLCNLMDMSMCKFLIKHNLHLPDSISDSLERESTLKLCKEVENYINSWEHHSGVDMYPVPSPNEEVSSMDAFHSYPLYEGEYGKMRLKLCKHILDNL